MEVSNILKSFNLIFNVDSSANDPFFHENITTKNYKTNSNDAALKVSNQNLKDNKRKSKNGNETNEKRRKREDIEDA